MENQVINISAILIAFLVPLLVYMVLLVKRQSIDSKWNREKGRMEMELIRKELELKQLEIVKKLEINKDSWEKLNHVIISSQNTIDEEDFEKDKRNSKVYLNNFLRDLGIKENHLQRGKKDVFVLTPFNEYAYPAFRAIQKTVADFGMKAYRGDEEFIEGEILPEIVKSIISARIIIANITGRNPNVFYELGIAHMLDKPVIIVSEVGNSVNFDIRSKFILFYDNENDLRIKLEKQIGRLALKENL